MGQLYIISMTSQDLWQLETNAKIAKREMSDAFDKYAAAREEHEKANNEYIATLKQLLDAEKNK